MTHRTLQDLLQGLDAVRSAPRDGGTVQMIVQRPRNGERIIIEQATLDPALGLVGDNWSQRHNRRAADGRPFPSTQLTLMNSRFVDLIAGSRDRWALAGDQLYVDLDLSEESLPAGTELQVGEARLAISAVPHTGCRQFVERYGADALQLAASDEGRRLRLRGVYARVVTAGSVRQGDRILRIQMDLGAGGSFVR